jgi:hypothetical protein
MATDKSPKKLRCDIIPELRKNSFRIIEDITRTNFCELQRFTIYYKSIRVRIRDMFKEKYNVLLKK